MNINITLTCMGFKLPFLYIQGLYSIPDTNLLHFFDAQASLAQYLSQSSVNPFVILSDFHSNSLSEPSESIEITLQCIVVADMVAWLTGS